MISNKVVKRFIFENDRCVIDLEDKANAIEVQLHDGLIVFREGDGEDRIDRGVVTSKSIQEFEVDSIGAQLCIKLHYKRQGHNAVHFIGYISDIIAAKHWVDRVNSIYNSTTYDNVVELFPRKKRIGVYSNFPVVHDILETKKDIILPGTYQYSISGIPSSLFSVWETNYVDRCIQILCERTGCDFKDIKQENFGTIPHDYSWLEDRIMYDSETFNYRITHPLELIFDKKQRHKKISVNAFGIVGNFAVVYFNNSKPQNALNLKEDEESFTTFHNFVEQLKINKLSVGTLSDESVYYSFYDAHLMGQFDVNLNFIRRNDVQSLAIWLYQNRDYGVVVCDIGEVLPLRNELIRYQGGNAAMQLQKAIVPYDKPVPVGFCYRNDDDMWGEINRQAIHDILYSTDTLTCNDIDEYKKRLNSLSIQLVAA